MPQSARSTISTNLTINANKQIKLVAGYEKIMSKPILKHPFQHHYLTFRKPQFIHLLSQVISINIYKYYFTQTFSRKREVTNRDKLGQNYYLLHLNTRSMLYATQTFKNLHFNWTKIWFAIGIFLFKIEKKKLIKLVSQKSLIMF